MKLYLIFILHFIPRGSGFFLPIVMVCFPDVILSCSRAVGPGVLDISKLRLM